MQDTIALTSTHGQSRVLISLNLLINLHIFGLQRQEARAPRGNKLVTNTEGHQPGSKFQTTFLAVTELITEPPCRHKPPPPTFYMTCSKQQCVIPTGPCTLVAYGKCIKTPAPNVLNVIPHHCICPQRHIQQLSKNMLNFSLSLLQIVLTTFTSTYKTPMITCYVVEGMLP